MRRRSEMLTEAQLAGLLEHPAAKIRELAIRALPRLTAPGSTAADRWARQVCRGEEAALAQLKRCAGAEFFPVMVYAPDHVAARSALHSPAELFPAYHFAEDASVLWSAGSMWRAAVLLGPGELADGSIWYSSESVLLRPASDEELDEWQARACA
jgi:hypothetical protein